MNTLSGITLRRLSKAYGHHVVLRDIDLHLEPGRVYGLLGANGVGKTTLMSVICNHTFPTSGTVRVDGEEPAENAQILERTCFIHEDQRWHDDFRLTTLLDSAALFFPNWSPETAQRLAERFQIPRTTKVKKLSRGQRSALAVTLSLASRAPYTFLDEPYLGLDPGARGLFYDELLREISEVPRTIIMSTHLIDEAASLLEEVILMRNGRVEMHADVDTVRAEAFFVRGQTDAVSAFVANREVMARQTMGRLESCLVRGHLDDAERRRADVAHLSIETPGLQDIVAALGILDAPAASFEAEDPDHLLVPLSGGDHGSLKEARS